MRRTDHHLADAYGNARHYGQDEGGRTKERQIQMTNDTNAQCLFRRNFIQLPELADF